MLTGRKCNSPEQFTTTWNNVDDFRSLAQDETAGKFDWWTNCESRYTLPSNNVAKHLYQQLIRETTVWQIGRLMTILVSKGQNTPCVSEPVLTNSFAQLTQQQAQVPPDCIWHEVTIGDGSKRRIPTYANPLVNDDALQGYDPLLIDTVAWCMAHMPGDRPTMVELEQRIVSAVNRDWSQEDESDRASIRQLLSMPPPPAQTS